MTHRLNHIAPVQLGIVLASLYGAMSLLFVPFLLLFTFFGAQATGKSGVFAGGAFFMILLPFLYAAGGFIIGVISAFVYNLLAKWTGGIEFTVTEVPPQVTNF